MTADGYTPFVVETYDTRTRRRHDLFGFLDILALGGEDIIGVQTTTASNVSARVKKITEHENLAAVRKAGIKIVVHGWKKTNTGWHCREVDLS